MDNPYEGILLCSFRNGNPYSMDIAGCSLLAWGILLLGSRYCSGTGLLHIRQMLSRCRVSPQITLQLIFSYQCVFVCFIILLRLQI